MMRKYFITFACIWLSMPLCGNAQEVEWVKKITANISTLNISQIVSSPQGDISIAQMYFTSDSTMFLDDKIIQQITLDRNEFFVAFFNSNGELQRLLQPLGRDNRRVHDLVFDNSCCFYLAGGSDGVAIFDTVVLDKNSLFLIKYDKQGRLIESYPTKYIGEYADADAFAVDINSRGIKYLTGAYFDGSIVLNNKDTLTKGNSFLLKLDSLNNKIWVKEIQAYTTKNPLFYNERCVVADSNGVLFAANIHDNSYYRFDTLQYRGANSDISLVKLDNDGNIIWYGFLGGKGKEVLGDVVLHNGKVFITGVTSGNMSFNGATFDNLKGGFLLSLDFNTGTPLWIKNTSPSIAFTKDGNLITAIDFRDTIYKGNKKFVSKRSNDTILKYNSDDIYLAILNSRTGETLWDTQMGGVGNETAPLVTTDTLGNVYILCHAQGATELGKFSFTIPYGSFLAKIKLPTLSVKNETTNEHKNNLQVLESDGMIKIKLPYKPYKSLLSCYNSIGEKLFTKNITPLTEVIELSKSTFTNGKYFCTIEHDGIAETISFVIQK